MVKAIVPKKPKPDQKPVISDRVLVDDAGNKYYTIGLGVIFRNNAKTIQALLDSITGLFDQVVFTDTGSTDGTRLIIKEWLRKNPDECGLVNDFAWIDDFAAARNFNFSFLKTRWKGFLDTDDTLLNGEKLRPIINRLERESPMTDGLFVVYDYDNLEQLDTARFTRGNWKWEDAIHERIVAKDDNGTVDRFARAKDVLVRHNKSEEDKPKALQRNYDIAVREYAKTNDPAYKSRLCRTIAMKLKAEHRYSEAVPFWKELAENYGHLPEGREAYADLMRSCLQQGDGVAPSIEFQPTREAHLEAMEFAKRAGPSYEALIFHGMKEFDKCIQKQSVGVYQPRQTTHECDITQYGLAQAALADSAMHLGYPPEAVEQALNMIPLPLRNHDVVFMFANLIRTSIDRITILVPGTPQPFDEDSTRGMLGGSESAVVHLSNALAALGRNVRVYTPLPPLRVPGIGPTGVDYQDFKDFSIENENGTIVVWRSIQLVDQLIDIKRKAVEAKARGERDIKDPTGSVQMSLWMHDQGTGAPPDINEILMRSCDSVIVLSEHHKAMVSRGMKRPELIRWQVLSNGIVSKRLIEHRVGTSEKDPFKVLYTSCPTRGLEKLLDMWPEVKKAVPQATLDIYYDWGGLKGANPQMHHMLCKKVADLKDLGVQHLGGVGHDELYDAMARARVVAYAHFDNPNVETSCISAMEITALCTNFLTVPNGALPETAPDATFCTSIEEYQTKLIELLSSPISDDETARLNNAADRMVSRLDWGDVAKRFSQIWSIEYLKTLR